MKTISVQQLAQQRRQGEVDLIDVRMPTEFRTVHAECARNVPLESLDPTLLMQAQPGSSGPPLYVICQSGNRSSQACRKFVGAGLMLAGMTGVCPIASVLAKMPWNQCDDQSGSCCGP